MISVTMAYYNRPELLRNTLWAYYHLHKNSFPYEFVIVDDCSDDDKKAQTITQEFLGLLNIRVYERKPPKTSRNPAIPINISVQKAVGNIVVITNPETLPLTPVLYTIKNLNQKDWLVCPCYSVNTYYQTVINNLNPTKSDFVEQIKGSMVIEDKPMCIEGEGAWYEHPVYMPRYYYFLAGILRDDFLAVGGIDEEFSEGIAFEDDDFKRRLITNDFKFKHFPGICLHQNHYTANVLPIVNTVAWNINQALFARKMYEQVKIANNGKEWGIYE